MATPPNSYGYWKQQERIDRIVRFIALQKFKLDLGSSFMTYANFVLMAITASPIIASTIHFRFVVVFIILVPSVFICVWLFGHIMDKLGYQKHYQHQQNLRNEMLQKAAGEQ